MTSHVLVAEDDPKQADLIRLYMESEGFVITVVTNGRSAIEAALNDRPALMIIDVMMPEIDGLEVCRQLGGDAGIPIILLTARSTESDVLAGLYLGADDYITKPFSPRELVARARTVMRRARIAGPPAGEAIVVGDLRVDVGRHQILVRGREVSCTPVEFDIVFALAARPGRVLSRRQLLEKLHGGADFMTERTVDSHVMNVRRKIELDPRRPQILLTVYGVGYKVAEVAAAWHRDATHDPPA